MSHLHIHVALLLLALISASPDEDHEYTNDFAVEIDGDMTVADLVAGSHSLRVVRHISNLGSVYHLVHDNVERRSRRSAEDIVARLLKDPNVLHAEQQRVLRREKRTVVHDKQVELPIRHFEDKSIYQRYHSGDQRISTKDSIPDMNDVNDFKFNDPFFNDQWYLLNRGQTGGTVGYDINVVPVWRKGITGQGIVVSILDDGIDHTHPDLQRNYDVAASADLNDRSDSDNDPMPNAVDPSNSHGTRCAGEVAAEANNSICCVGVAYNAKIGGVRMLDGSVTDLLEAEAVTYNNQYVEIFSASWGPTDDGKTMEGPHRYCERALQEGATKGRGGKGSIFVWATGNGGSVGDDCSCDGYVSSIYTLSVGCISDHGLSTYFSEVCPSTIAVVFTGGSHNMPGAADYKAPKIKVVTTDLHDDCTLEFQGTSSAAPLAAGCIALVLEANRNLTWRDVQNVVVETARIPNAEEDGWTVNGGGYHVNHRFGFGALDCGRMVEAAQSWISVQEQHICHVAHTGLSVEINAGESVESTLTVRGCHDDDSIIDHLEHVQIQVQLEHERRGDVSLVLVSPSGTHSNILSRRPLDNSTAGIDFRFMTVHHWGEDPAGTWTLKIEDRPTDGSMSNGRRRGRLRSWSLILYGVAGEQPNHHSTEHSANEIHRRPSAVPVHTDDPEQAHLVGTSEVKELMEKEAASSDSVHIQSKDEMASKRNERRRSWLLKKGFDSRDVDFLIALFETEEEEYKQQSAAEKKSETTSYHRNQHRGSSSENPSNWYRRAYDTRWRSHGSPSKRILEGSETDRQRIVDHDAADDGVNTVSWRELLDELSAILEDE